MKRSECQTQQSTAHEKCSQRLHHGSLSEGGETTDVNVVLTDSVMSTQPLAGADNWAAGRRSGQTGLIRDAHFQSHRKKSGLKELMKNYCGN